MKRSPIRKVSKKRAVQNRIYVGLFPEFFDEHRFCEVPHEVHDCTIFAVPPPHHMNGRYGKKLLDIRDWLPTCNNGHKWIEDNKKQARRLGLIKYK